MTIINGEAISIINVNVVLGLSIFIIILTNVPIMRSVPQVQYIHTSERLDSYNGVYGPCSSYQSVNNINHINRINEEPYINNQ